MNKRADAEAAWRAGLDKADDAADVELLLQLQGQLNPPAAPAIATAPAPAAASEPKPGTQILFSTLLTFFKMHS